MDSTNSEKILSSKDIKLNNNHQSDKLYSDTYLIFVSPNPNCPY